MGKLSLLTKYVDKCLGRAPHLRGGVSKDLCMSQGEEEERSQENIDHGTGSRQKAMWL